MLAEVGAYLGDPGLEAVGCCENDDIYCPASG